MIKLMIDIETLDTKISAAMFAIGLAWFDENKIIGSKQMNVNVNSLVDRTISQETLRFWSEMPEIFQAQMENNDSIRNVLLNLNQEFKNAPEVSEIWAYGPSFDLAILKSYYEKLYLPIPWTHRMERDYRTLKNLPDFTEVLVEGTNHNAKDDAIFQATNVINYFKKRKGERQ